MNTIKGFVCVYIILLLVFTFGVILSHTIPYSWISNNVESSITMTKTEGDYPENLNTYIYRIDNYTDGGVMLNVAKYANSNSPVESAMLMRVVDDGTGYGRYWHGYQIFLRPLLIVFDIVKIRWLNYALFCFLILYSTLLMIQKLSKEIAFAWIATLLIINFQIVPHCMQFSCCFYITMIAMIAIIKYDKLTMSVSARLYTFFIIGALTSFFDLLTTPTLTLGLPLSVLLLKGEEENRSIKQILYLSIAWGIGYVLLWTSKWGMEYLFTGVNIFEEARNQVEFRLAGGVDSSVTNILKIAYSYSMSIFVCVTFLMYLYFNYRKSDCLRRYSFLLLIALIPFAWFVVVHQHSITHFLFTWRSFAVSIFCILVYIAKTICLGNSRTTK